jgi:hypothetical protein
MSVNGKKIALPFKKHQERFQWLMIEFDVLILI